MSIWTRVTSALAGNGNGASPPINWGAVSEITPADRYAVQRHYYNQNGLYSKLAVQMRELGVWTPAMRALRNPAGRIVEFHAAHLWPGTLPEALPIQTENPDLTAAVEQVWAWSNWDTKKQVYARWLAMLGDAFIQVVQPADRPRVYLQLLDPAHVTDFETDERGYLTEVRIDIPQSRREGSRTINYWHTEVWSKADQLFRRWEHTRPGGEEITRLGPPVESIPFSQMGIDFVPIVHAKFRDTGEARGVGAFWLQLEKIDQVNAEATRLSQMLFRHNKPTWALHGSGNDPQGRPLPPPRVSAAGDGADVDTVTFRDDMLIRLPGTAQLTPLVPSINFEAHRLAIQDALLDLQQDCPEMAYWRVMEMGAGAVSGRALNYILGPAVKRALEARGNGEGALIRAQQMALTIGSGIDLWDLGSFDAGDFAHRFAEREVIPINELERAEVTTLRGDDWGVRERLRKDGYSEDDIERLREEKEEDTPPALRAVDAFPARPGQGQQEEDEA